MAQAFESVEPPHSCRTCATAIGRDCPFEGEPGSGRRAVSAARPPAVLAADDRAAGACDQISVCSDISRASSTSMPR
jgi:hypothetical protein